MIDKLRDVRGKFLDFFAPDWVHPLYFWTAVLVVVCVFEVKHIKNWESLTDGQRGLLRALLFATTVALTGSVLFFLGII